MSKKCSRCKETKPESEFHKHSKRPDGLNTQCKKCRNSYLKNWYKDNKELHLQRVKKSKQRNRDMFLEYKQTLKCTNCPEDRWYVLDFHHKNPEEKEFNISEGLRDKISFKRMMKEVAKCDVLCKNCHAALHYVERLT